MHRVELHKIVYKKMSEMMNDFAKAAQNSGLQGKIKTDETFLMRGAKRAPASCGMDGKGALPLKKYAKTVVLNMKYRNIGLIILMT